MLLIPDFSHLSEEAMDVNVEDASKKHRCDIWNIHDIVNLLLQSAYLVVICNEEKILHKKIY